MLRPGPKERASGTGSPSTSAGASDGTTRMFLMCSSFSYEPQIEAAIDSECERHGLRREIIQCALAEGGPRIQSFTLLPKPQPSTAAAGGTMVGPSARLVSHLSAQLEELHEANSKLKSRLVSSV